MYHRSYLFVMAVLGSFAVLAPAAGAQSLVFKFNPPDSVDFTVEIRSERIRWVDSTKNPTDSTISEVHRKIRRTDSGWVMTSRPISTITTSDGRVMDNPIARVLQTVTAKCKLDSAGLITKVIGFEGITPRIDSIALGPNAQRLREVLSPENLSAKEEMDWNGKLQGLHGKPIKIGWIDYEQAQYPLPGGNHIPFLIGIRVIDTLRVDGKLCAILVMSADSDPNEIAKRLRRPSDEIASEFPLQDGPGMAIIKGGSRYMSESVFVLQIATLLPQSETLSREISVQGEPGSGPKKIRLVESETRKYTYH